MKIVGNVRWKVLGKSWWLDFVLGKCSLESSSDVLRYNCPHVSKYGVRCLQYIPLARL